ncbi:MAG: hypothetical protein RL516_393 [Bacteroidota bacterium]|jgi:hypothetical protein
MKKRIFILLTLAIVYLSNCTTEVSNSSIKLFNSASYIRSEIVLLNKNNSHLLKTAEYNSKKEMFQLDTVNWNKELELIVASNISEKYLSYTIDTLQQNDSTIITYSSKETKSEVRKFVVVKHQNSIKRIAIERMKENTFYYSKQEIEYIPQTFFSINAKEKMILSDTTYYRITGVIN